MIRTFDSCGFFIKVFKCCLILSTTRLNNFFIIPELKQRYSSFFSLTSLVSQLYITELWVSFNMDTKLLSKLMFVLAVVFPRSFPSNSFINDSQSDGCCFVNFLPKDSQTAGWRTFHHKVLLWISLVLPSCISCTVTCNVLIVIKKMKVSWYILTLYPTMVNHIAITLHRRYIVDSTRQPITLLVIPSIFTVRIFTLWNESCT